MDRRQKTLSLILAGTLCLLAGCGPTGQDTENSGAALSGSSRTSSAGESSGGSAPTVVEGLKPGDEGFSFAYVPPENWEPEEFPADNGAVMRDIFLGMDGGKGLIPPELYYTQEDSACRAAKVLEEDEWEMNPIFPRNLYTMPASAFVMNNTCRTVGGKEFSALNPGLTSYYAEAAERAVSSCLNYDYKDLDTFKNNALFYQLPTTPYESTFIPQDIELYTKMQQKEESVFVTDPSLCYLAADGSIRVRGLCLYVITLPDSKTFSVSYMEAFLGVTPDSAKNQPCQWEFGDFYLINFFDVMQGQIITEQEFNDLLEKYGVELGVKELPSWAGVYGGNLS